MANCGKVEQICISQVTIPLTEDYNASNKKAYNISG